jgi:CD2 antigen cytoplasmic tail-binding protein 2
MNADDIEGEEAGDSFVNADEEIKFTPFNMKEELEEGHFDRGLQNNYTALCA